MNEIEKNKEHARRFYEEIMNRGNADLVDEILSDDFIEHEEIPGVPPNREGVKQWVNSFRTAFPDLKMEIEDMIAEGDTVVARGRMMGTHEGEFFGNKGTGRKLDLPFVDIVRFRDGKCTEHWGYSDTLKMVEQLQLDLSAVPQ